MKNILICTDGSNYGLESCRYAAWLSQASGARISVLYVTDLRQFEIPAMADFSGSLGIQPFEGMVSKLREVEEFKANFVKESAFAALEKEGVDSNRITFHHETGTLVDVMADYSDVADLVLIGKRGENANFATEHLGSMLERILRSIDRPCLVTNREFKPVKRVAIAYDGGESARKAIRFISDQPLFHAFEFDVLVCVEGHDEAEAGERLKEAEAMLLDSGLHPRCQMLNGEVESAIVNYVENSAIDLLMLGAYGHSRIRELLIGSTTTELLRRCHVPVFCFR